MEKQTGPYCFFQAFTCEQLSFRNEVSTLNWSLLNTFLGTCPKYYMVPMIGEEMPIYPDTWRQRNFCCLLYQACNPQSFPLDHSQVSLSFLHAVFQKRVSCGCPLLSLLFRSQAEKFCCAQTSPLLKGSQRRIWYQQQSCLQDF